MHSRVPSFVSWCLIFNWLYSSSTAEMMCFRQSDDKLTKLSFPMQTSLRWLQHASEWVGIRQYSLRQEAYTLEKVLQSSLGGPGSIASRLPPELKNWIVSLVPRGWSGSKLEFRNFEPIRYVYVLNVNWTSLDRIKQAHYVPRIDLEVFADAITPNFFFDFDGSENDEPVLFTTQTCNFGSFTRKLKALSELADRIRLFEFRLVTAHRIFLPLLEAAGCSFWYPEDLIVNAKAPGANGFEGDHVDLGLGDDTLIKVEDALRTKIPRTGTPKKPKRATLTSPLLQPFAAVGLLSSVTQLTLTASDFHAYLPQKVTADLPALRDLNIYNIHWDLGQPSIHLGHISTLRVPSLSFIELCSPSEEVRCLGIRTCDYGDLSPETTRGFLSKIVAAFPRLKQLETVSLANAFFFQLNNVLMLLACSVC